MHQHAMICDSRVELLLSWDQETNSCIRPNCVSSMNDLIKSDSNYKCVYWQQFCKVSLSPCGDFLYAVKCWTSPHPWTWTTELSVVDLYTFFCFLLFWLEDATFLSEKPIGFILFSGILQLQTEQRLKEEKLTMMKTATILAALKTTRSRWGYEYPAHTFSMKLNWVLSVHRIEWMTGLCWISSAAFPSAEGRVVPECGLDGVARCRPCWINLCGRKRLSPLCLPFTL